MPLSEGIEAGLKLRDYVENNAQKMEHSRLQAQLFKSQADHFDAQNKLIDLQMQQHQAMQGLVQQAQGQGQLRDYMTQNPEQAQAPSYEAEPGMVGPPRLGSAIMHPELASMVNQGAAQATMPPKPLEMTTLAAFAGQSGLLKESAQLQEAAVKHQTLQLQVRTQQLQDQAGVIINAMQTIPQTDPERVGKLNFLQKQLASTMGQLGKSNEMVDLLLGKQNMVGMGGSLTTTNAAGTTEAFRSPVNPADLAGLKERQALNIRLYGTPEPPAGQPQATEEMIREIGQRGVNRANENPTPPVSTPPGTAPSPQAAPPAAPGPVPANREAKVQQLMDKYGVSRELAEQSVDKQQPRVGAAPALGSKAAQADLNVQLYGTPTPPQGQPNATDAMLKKKSTQAELEGQTGKPGATVEDVATGKTMGENLEQNTRDLLSNLTRAQTLVRQLQGYSPATAEKAIGLFRRPQTEWARLTADISKAGGGDPELEDFIVTASELFTVMGRSVINFGSQFTTGEQELIKGFIPSGKEYNYGAFQAKLKNLPSMLADKLKSTRENATVTRGDLKRQDQGQGTTAPQGPGAATKETPEQIEQRIRQQMNLAPRTP